MFSTDVRITKAKALEVLLFPLNGARPTHNGHTLHTRSIHADHLQQPIILEMTFV